MKEHANRRNVILDLLRILATAEVFLMHLTLFVPEEVGNKVFAVLSKVSSRGANGVAILFCLSGYFIYRELAEGTRNQKQFYIRRWKRIVPVYYLVLILYLITGLLPFNLNIFRYFFFVNGIVPSQNYQLYNNMGAFWTMGCFMLWYFAAPWYQRWIKSLRGALAALVGTFVAGQLSEILLKAVYTVVHADQAEFMLGNNPFGNLYFFCMGIVAYYLIQESKTGVGILISAAAVTILSFLNSPWYPYWTFLTVIFILLSEEVTLNISKGIYRGIVFLSNISFDCYLVHLGVIRLMDGTHLQEAEGSLVFVVCTMAVTLFCAVAVYGIDKYVFQRALAKFR